ncbi:hypothetical protein LTR86_004711 [Recurvomyces mirabilis]|nr:hypothetical protein LTR86_004711 [Recurvomyces mirabilis]
MDDEGPYEREGLGITLASTSQGKSRRHDMQTPSHEQRYDDSPNMTMSPPSTGGFSGSTFFDSPRNIDTAYHGLKPLPKPSGSSLRSSAQPSLYPQSETGLLSIRSRYDDFEPREHCRSHKPVVRKWFSKTIFALSIFSTGMSAVFVGTAIGAPRYGRYVTTNGLLTASSAATLTTSIAKLIELSFITVLVACIGQILARRAYRLESGSGVTLAEMSMRSWVVQPGTMLTQWQSVRYAGITFLGVVSLVGALCAMLYAPAATALVQPQLKWADWRPQVMYGKVKSQFANPKYVQRNCKTPIQQGYDSDSATTCLQMEHAAMGYHNYFSYMNTWTTALNNGTNTSDPTLRPVGYALLSDNTTITASWIEQTDVAQLQSQYGLVINNISMAMPHPGVIQAAIDSKNNILQPGDLDGLGVYNIRASVPSPVVHVLCVTLTQEQIQPFVYELWENVTSQVDMTAWPQQLGNYSGYDAYLGGTDLDDIFRWGGKYGAATWPPVFGKVPIDYNTIINDTTHVAAYGREAIYLLGKGGPTDPLGNAMEDQNYALCQIQASQSPNCSTSYNASSSGAQLAARCEDDSDEFAYIRTTPAARRGNETLSADWPNIAFDWSRSLALNDGTFDGNGSNARLLTQLMLTQPKLNPALPSMAEALAVLAGCTLLSSSVDAPFIGYWNYSLPVLDSDDNYQTFAASIRAQQYASGGFQPYQKAFHIVLVAVLVMNVACLLYFLTHRHWYTDFSEPTTLFSLAVNSPPCQELAGSCGGGPEGEHYKVSWKLNTEGEHVYLESLQKEESGDRKSSPLIRRRRKLSQGFDLISSPRHTTGDGQSLG